jgi:hypothetical protein
MTAIKSADEKKKFNKTTTYILFGIMIAAFIHTIFIATYNYFAG